MAIGVRVRICIFASAVVSVEKSATSTRLRAAVRWVTWVSVSLMADCGPFCDEPSDARALETSA
jgi:hypothetical protein